MDYSHVTMVGRLTRAPELRYTPSGTPLATFSIAINHRYKQGDELKEEVCYVDVVAFGKTGEACAMSLAQGHRALVDGRLQQRRWETDDGQKRSKHEIIADRVIFLDRREEQPA